MQQRVGGVFELLRFLFRNYTGRSTPIIRSSAHASVRYYTYTVWPDKTGRPVMFLMTGQLPSTILGVNLRKYRVTLLNFTKFPFLSERISC